MNIVNIDRINTSVEGMQRSVSLLLEAIRTQDVPAIADTLGELHKILDEVTAIAPELTKEAVETMNAAQALATVASSFLGRIALASEATLQQFRERLRYGVDIRIMPKTSMNEPTVISVIPRLPGGK
jgi:methyl-accepting chemotaxis protein